MENTFEIIVQYGAMGAILGWFMWRDLTVMKEFTQVINDFRRTIAGCSHNFSKKEG